MAIDCYTEAILQSSVTSPGERSNLYCNRAASFLALVQEGISLEKLTKTERDYFNDAMSTKASPN